LLQQADMITVHSPLTSETRHLLGEREFGLMKRGMILVNTSRGAVIDEPALIQALRSGRVKAAGLDVMEQEPLPSDSPLRELDQVALTPHIGSYSVEAVQTLYRSSAQVGADLLKGRWVRTIVNPDVRAKAEKRWGPYIS
jgi:D-3-phosphoglycerate dehydrogenase / 2-oxoglutarate reductase